ncbi:potassium transporter Kup [Microvirga sp. VF16]|uniref:potassium transporter Kup n=1 Tax=Microvirga sp. VF16 TaxID=2807101 RepID=UPI00193EB756|nr:KUP/HAK/KT family potassium transporter [Microvirga sp. VF16]QRM28376.1 KUP/HAK/KT family potassium transporter [Microvirga sp. VF16]
MATVADAHADDARAGIASRAVVLGALGVVFGDIGTSPLYALREAAVAANHGVLSPATVMGVLSLILWSLIVVISIKYCLFILRADNRGEGGIIALLALLGVRRIQPGSWRMYLTVIGLIGTALLYADGTITPAISVLSAIEGLAVDAKEFEPYVLPITMAILVTLFSVQRMGTGRIGRIFGPFMLIWFSVLGLLGLGGIVAAPGVIAAINPIYALAFLIETDIAVTLAVLAAVFLTVTGGEALYADLGHFGPAPIRNAWFFIVLPALMLNYFGQGALLLTNPGVIESPFYHLAPDWAHYPLVVLATLATVIASQAVITGAFSLTQQAIQLGFMPRMRVIHTSSHERGHVYVPFVNWTLAMLTFVAVLGFGSSSNLAGAYGLAVSLDMVITTILATFVALHWGHRPILVYLLNGTLLLVDLVFFAANTTKLLEGGWFPLLIALSAAFMMLTWRKGQQLVQRARTHLRMSTKDFQHLLERQPPIRIPGTAVVMSASTSGVPGTLLHHLKHNKVLHETVFLVSVVVTDEPTVEGDERVHLMPICEGVQRLVLRLGFTETPDVPTALRLAVARLNLPDLDPDTITYYVGRQTVVASKKLPGMAFWREVIFAMLNRNAELTADYFCIPAAQVVEIGSSIEI